MSFPYRVNDVVLARVPNGKIYYTKIKSISVARKECVAEFDDGSLATVDWTNIFDVAAETDVIVCVVCKQGDSDTPNEIILCDTCNVGYHQECHPTKITAQHIAQDKWYCLYCVNKRKNPYVTNPFENSRSRSPSKRKRKLTKSPSKPKANPKKRKTIVRPTPKPSKTSKSFVAKKCTVSIIKQSIQELESVVPVKYSDSSNCSLGEAKPVTPPQESTKTDPTPPVSPPLPHRPVNAVQPLNHSMVYPVCSPPPLQMSPLIKKPLRIPSSSPPPLITPRDVTVNRDVIMSSLPPLQKARDVDCDPLRNVADGSSSSWTCTSLPSSKLKKSPVCATNPVQPSANVLKPSKTVEDTNTSQPDPAPSLSESPEIPTVDSVSNISSEQIRSLYMRLYDFLQQSRAQGNPMIDREVVQHLISYGNDQIQRLSTSSSILDSERLDERSVSTTSQRSSLNNADNVKEPSLSDTSSTSEKFADASAEDNSREVDPQLHDSKIGLVTDHTVTSTVACPENESTPLSLKSDTDKGVKSGGMLVDQTNRGMANSSEKGTIASENMSPSLNTLPSPFGDTSTLSTPILQKFSQAHHSCVKKLKETLNDVPHSVQNMMTKSVISAGTAKLVCTTEASKPDTESKSTKKMICQPLAPIDTHDMMGPFIQPVRKKSIKNKTTERNSSSSNKKHVSSTKADLLKGQSPKNKEVRRSTKSSRKRPKPDPPIISEYTAVQAGNSVIITPNSTNDLSKINAVPVQFITEAGAPTSDDLPEIAEYSTKDGQCATKQKSAEGKPLSIHPSPSQCQQPDQPPLSVNSPTNSIPSALDNHPINPPTNYEPSTPLSTSLNPGPLLPPTEAVPASNLEPSPRTSAVPPFTYSTSGQKNETSIRTIGPVETSNTNQKSDEGLKTDSPIAQPSSSIPAQQPCEQSASLPSTAPDLQLNNVLTNSNSTSKPGLRSESLITSDTKRTFTSDRPNLTRESKNQAKDNIKSFTIFDSYSSLFDSDDEGDDVFVTQKPSPQTPVNPTRVDGYNHVTSQCRASFGRDNENATVAEDVVKETISSGISLGERNIVTTANISPDLTQLSQAVPTPSSSLSLEELVGLPVSTTAQTQVSVSKTSLDLITTPGPTISAVTSTTSSMNSSEFFSTERVSTPSTDLLSSSFDLETSQEHSMDKSSLTFPASPPFSQLDSTSSGPTKSVIVMARHISQIVHQLLVVASVKRTSELAVRAVVIKLEERRTAVNILSAALLHGLISAAVKSDKIREPVPVTSSQNQCSVPVTSSQNLCSVPVTSSQNLCSVPVTSSQNQCSVPVTNSQNLCSVPVTNSQNQCSVPSSNTQVRAEKVARTHATDENSEPNKNNISGQCYNCYSPAQIACRRCATALYCSLRCELEHLAIHRRECCKRQS